MYSVTHKIDLHTNEIINQARTWHGYYHDIWLHRNVLVGPSNILIVEIQIMKFSDVNRYLVRYPWKSRWADWWIMKWMVADELQIHLSRMKRYDDYYVLNCMYARFETKWWSGSFTGKMMLIDLEKWYRGVQCKTKSDIVNERDRQYSTYLA